MNFFVDTLEQQDSSKAIIWASNIVKLESEIHRGDQREVLLCIKESIQSYKNAKAFFSFNKGETGNIFLKVWKSAKKVLKDCHPLVNKIINISRGLYLTITYLIDFVKDIYFIILLFQFLPSVFDFSAFSVQVPILMIISIAIPAILNLFAILTSSNQKSRIVTPLYLMNFVTIPLFAAVSVYIAARLCYLVNKLTLNLKSKCHQLQQTSKDMKMLKRLKSSSRHWRQMAAQLKVNENGTEHIMQAVILLIIVAIKFSSSSTISGLQEFFAGDQIHFIAISSIWSILSITLGKVKQVTTEKEGTIPVKGKLIFFLYSSVSLFTRLGAIFIYFAPSLGIFNILMHWKMGQLQPAIDLKVPYDKINKNVTLFTDVWKPLQAYTDLTIWSLEVYFKTFSVMILLHFLVIFLIKKAFSKTFRSEKGKIKQLFHIFSQSSIPSCYTDWDHCAVTELEVQTNWLMTTREVRATLLLFTIEHILMCIPVVILSINISKRNHYLEEFFSILPEEQNSTTLAYTLASMGPVVFTVMPFIQYWLFRMFHTFGHPWRSLLKSNEKPFGKKTSVSFYKRMKLFFTTKTEEEMVFREFWDGLMNWKFKEETHIHNDKSGVLLHSSE
jgi:hypothetical protein